MTGPEDSIRPEDIRPEDRILWEPSPERVASSVLAEFASRHGPYSGQTSFDYDGLHRWSIDQPAAFWESIWEFCGVIGEPGDTVFEPGADMRTAGFFPDATLNFAENLLRRSDQGEAIVALGEDGRCRRVTWQELNVEVGAFSAWLDEVGVQAGDRVVAVLPNIAETVIAMLGTSALGGVFSSASPDFGEQGLLDRFAQVDPKVLIACDGYQYNGKIVYVRERIAAVVKRLPTLEQVVIVPYMDLGVTKGTLDWNELVDARRGRPVQFRQLPFDHPLYIMFTSGTTGIPKCIVHRAGGVLIQHLKEHRLLCGLRPDHRTFYFTTCGWMMWNWLVSTLASEATVMLYDGSPFYPDGNRMFDFVQDERIEFFGTSAKFIDSVKKAGLRPAETHPLPALETLASTGSPLVPESFDFVYEHIKKDVALNSVSGGTDLLACFVGANPQAPVHRGEIQAPALGMAVEIWNDAGEPVVEELGELVCTRPFPTMPLHFWNDPDGTAFESAYFAKFPGIWCHGDLALQTRHGGYLIMGRSDAVLNPGGVRIGTAEIYRQVEQLDEVLEAVAVAQTWEGDVRVVLFVVLLQGVALTEALTHEIKTRIRAGATPRHVPRVVVAVADIPRTRSGKISELAVRDIIHGREVKNVEALANPEALDCFRDLDALA
jgi:acetoacetyl-CoA synthetase